MLASTSVLQIQLDSELHLTNSQLWQSTTSITEIFWAKTETDFVYNWYSNLFIAYLKNESDNNTIILIVVFITSQYYFSYLVGNQVITTPLFK